VRRLIASVAFLGALGLAGCYGSTEPATDIDMHGARLNGSGTLNNGPAAVFFQFWPTAFPSRVQETRHVNIPAGASGPFGQHTAVQLAFDTDYSFRLCADEGGGPLCAQTRKFHMTKPAGDAVFGEVAEAYGFRSLFIEAQSGPSGESPSGNFSVFGAFNGTVTSMQVVGHRAAVYARGTAIQGSNSFNAAACATIGDAGPGAAPGTGDVADAQIALTDFGQTVSCSPPPADFTGEQDGVAVYDAPAP
jgi:hypothetical protein